jgi:hypothetical protein
VRGGGGGGPRGVGSAVALDGARVFRWRMGSEKRLQMPPATWRLDTGKWEMSPASSGITS